MQLYVIGPERAAPVAVGLARSAVDQLETLTSAWPGPGRLVIHREHELPRGWDQLALAIASRQLRATASTAEGWFREKPQQAALHIDLALRAIEGVKVPPERPSQSAFVRHFREHVLGTTQNVLGAIAGVSESAVSRWEAGDLTPDLYAVHRMREFARTAGLPWQDSWPFEAP